jgi:hypothetical protein
MGCMLFQWAAAQYAVHTMVPQKTVAPGTAFQVQYVVQQSDNFVALKTPDFGPQFTLISGPRIYPGMSMRDKTKTSIQNFTYTLIPLTEGRLVIKGATAVYKDAVLKSEDVTIMVQEKSTQENEGSLPVFSSAQLEEEIGDYLFVKTDITKKEVYVGQPVVATYTLYSRLEASSEVIKNPGFYGFSVVEITAAKEHEQAIEMYKGQLYNTHIIRKLQLYPLQAGRLEIDEMLLNNNVLYTDASSTLPKKLEVAVASDKVVINVKALPPQPPLAFTGAVGQFAVKSYLVQTKMPLNKEGLLKVEVSGTGNFIEVTAPAITWPAGITGFDAKETDQLKKDKVPIAGTKVYTFHFTADSTGTYTFAPVAFSYFDPLQKRYKTLTTDPLELQVVEKEKVSFIDKIKSKREVKNSWWLLLTGLLVAAAGLVIFFRNKKKKNTQAPQTKPAAYIPPDYGQQLNAIEFVAGNEKEAYSQLQQWVVAVVQDKYGLTNAGSKEKLLQQLKEKGASETIVKQTSFVLQQCEASLYYGAPSAVSFTDLKKEAATILQQTT